MNIIHLNKYHDICNAYEAVKDSFPDLESRVNINDYLKKLSDNADVFAAEIEGNICGFAAIYTNDYNLKTAFITLIGVSNAFKRKGVGSRLFDFCLNHAKQKGMTVLKLEVNKCNAPAIALYRKYGMEITSDASDKSYFMEKYI